MKSISYTKQSNLFLHFLSTSKRFRVIQGFPEWSTFVISLASSRSVSLQELYRNTHSKNNWGFSSSSSSKPIFLYGEATFTKLLQSVVLIKYMQDYLARPPKFCMQNLNQNSLIQAWLVHDVYGKNPFTSWTREILTCLFKLNWSVSIHLDILRHQSN